MMRVHVVLLVVFSLFLISYGDTLSQQEKIEVYTEWLDTNGFERTFDISLIDGKRIGGIANREIEPEDILYKIPEEWIIYNSFCKDLNGWKNWWEAVPFEPLMMWVLKEKTKDDSPWKPYLDLFPESVDNHVLLWKESDFEYANYTNLRGFKEGVTSKLRVNYEYISEELQNNDYFPIDYFTFEKYLWAFITVSSHSSLVEKDGKDEFSLIPLSEILFHKQDSSKGGEVNSHKQYTVTTRENYNIGDEVFDSYGVLSNFQLLSTYGFIVDENPNDSALITFALDIENNTIHKKAHDILVEESPLYYNIRIQRNRKPHKLLRLFRILQLEEGYKESSFENIMNFKDVSVHLERMAMRKAVAQLINYVNELPSEEEEKKILALPSLTENQRISIKLRMGEKKVIEETIEMIKRMWKNILIDGELPGGARFLMA